MQLVISKSVCYNLQEMWVIYNVLLDMHLNMDIIMTSLAFWGSLSNHAFNSIMVITIYANVFHIYCFFFCFDWISKTCIKYPTIFYIEDKGFMQIYTFLFRSNGYILSSCRVVFFSNYFLGLGKVVTTWSLDPFSMPAMHSRLKPWKSCLPSSWCRYGFCRSMWLTNIPTSSSVLDWDPSIFLILKILETFSRSFENCRVFRHFSCFIAKWSVNFVLVMFRIALVVFLLAVIFIQVVPNSFEQFHHFCFLVLRGQRIQQSPFLQKKTDHGSFK